MKQLSEREGKSNGMVIKRKQRNVDAAALHNKTIIIKKEKLNFYYNDLDCRIKRKEKRIKRDER